MKIFHASDSHGFHSHIKIPEEADVFVFSGDAENDKDIYRNYWELCEFLEWAATIKIPKVFTLGNHSVWSAKNEKKTRKMYEDAGINLLINQELILNGVKFWGSPVTPSFGNDWAYNRNRGKIHKTWDLIPYDVEVLITHGPPQGILDLSDDLKGNLVQCGCKSLGNKIKNLLSLSNSSLKLAAFGHIHSHEKKGFKNNGVFLRDGIIYSNGSVVSDCSDHLEFIGGGNLIEI